jgi:DNA replication protein DnaC
VSTDLHARLRGLNLHALADDFDDVAANAIKKRWSPTQLMEHIVTIEEQERSRRSLERRLQLSKLGHFKPASDFDWKWPDRINADAVHAALTEDARQPDTRWRAATCSWSWLSDW